MSDYPELTTLSLVGMLDDIPEICFIYRDDGVMTHMNRRCEKYVGVSRERVVNIFNMFENRVSFDDQLWEGYLDAFKGELRRIPASMARLPRIRDGETFYEARWIETTLVPLLVRENGTACFVLGIQHDVTESIQIRDDIKDARATIDVQRDTIASLKAAYKQIEVQQATIKALTTPVIEVWDGVVTLPLLGNFNAERTARMSAQLLADVTRVGARYVILDLTGLTSVDTTTCEQLLRVIASLKLLGAAGV
ncbi:MAG: STAS domain-containing protein, partial [Nannocystaceae bacterium]